MIYVTGDTHGTLDLKKIERFALINRSDHTRDDSLIIAGDFGAVWSSETLNKKLAPYNDFPFRILFVDGNHENFDMLNEYPVEVWNGGKVHKISDNVIHLMRGQIFVIEGKRILTLGGATSSDKKFRRTGTEWWEQENIDMSDIDEALCNLKEYDGKVEYVITHSCSANLLMFNSYKFRKYNIGLTLYPENNMLNILEDNLKEFKHWYFGHYHFDCEIDGRHTALFDNIVELK